LAINSRRIRIMRVIGVIASKTAGEAEVKFREIQEIDSTARMLKRSIDRLQVIPLSGSGVSSRADLVAGEQKPFLMLIEFEEA
jgi:hypothetical protein